jgi:membrane-bound acyltransferase YfiQ involved in biofilm formation
MKLLHGSTLTITALLMITENVCPLTTLEQHLEQKTEITGTHHKSFLNRYLAQILYINVPPWAITTITISLTLTAILFYFVLPWIRRKNIIKPR